jgi:hypothetical protein
LRLKYPGGSLFAIEVLRHPALATKLLAFLNIPSAVRTPARHTKLTPPDNKWYAMVSDGSTEAGSIDFSLCLVA